MQHKDLTVSRRSGLLTIAVSSVLVTAIAVVVGIQTGVVADALGTDSGQADVGRPIQPQELERPTTSPSATGNPSRSFRARTKTKLPPYKVAPKPQRLRLAPVEVAVPFTLRVGTLNILGSNHTHHSKTWAPGVSRSARQAVAVSARGIDVLGMQEVQTDQLAVLDNNLPGYSIWPGTSLGSNGYRLQVAWRADKYDLVDTGTITTVFSGQMRPIPWVRLKSRANGAEFYFVTIHNSPRGLEGERDAATGPEIALANSLLASGLPVFLVGDTNDTSEFFCRVAPATGMGALNGATASSGCQIPPQAGLDWILGGWRGGAGVGFSGYHREPLPGLTDHPIVYGDATLTATVLKDPVSGKIVK